MTLDITLIDALLTLMLFIMLFMLLILLVILFGMKRVFSSIHGIISKTSGNSLTDRAK